VAAYIPIGFHHGLIDGGVDLSPGGDQGCADVIINSVVRRGYALTLLSVPIVCIRHISIYSIPYTLENYKERKSVSPVLLCQNPCPYPSVR
jgi:hypothetical protein